LGKQKIIGLNFKVRGLAVANQKTIINELINRNSFLMKFKKKLLLKKFEMSCIEGADQCTAT
jgi:hypothetical protein